MTDTSKTAKIIKVGIRPIQQHIDS